MGRIKKPKYTKELCGKMYHFFIGYEDRGLPSFHKFARSVGMTVEDLERFRKTSTRFEKAYLECREIRRDYIIDRALDKRFDGSFAKYLLSSDTEEADSLVEITLNLHVSE